MQPRAIDVAGRRDVFGRDDLLGGQIIGRADHFAPARIVFVVVAQKAGQTQVRNFRVSGGRHQQVARLHVAMDQARGCGRGPADGGLRNDRGGFGHRQPAADADEIAQVAAGDAFGHQKIDVAVVAGVERPDQVFVIHLGLGTNFAREAGDRHGGRFIAGQHFDGHGAAHHRVLGPKDLAHPPLADRVDHLVRAEIEFRPPAFELLDLPGIEPAHRDQLGGQAFVVVGRHGRWPDARRRWHAAPLRLRASGRR